MCRLIDALGSYATRSQTLTLAAQVRLYSQIGPTMDFHFFFAIVDRGQMVSLRASGYQAKDWEHF